MQCLSINRSYFLSHFTVSSIKSVVLFIEGFVSSLSEHSYLTQESPPGVVSVHWSLHFVNVYSRFLTASIATTEHFVRETSRTHCHRSLKVYIDVPLKMQPIGVETCCQSLIFSKVLKCKVFVFSPTYHEAISSPQND